MRPGTCERDIEVIAAALGGKAALPGRPGAAVLRHPVAEASGRAHETPRGRALRILLIPPDAIDQEAHRPHPLFTPPSISSLSRLCFHPLGRTAALGHNGPAGRQMLSAPSAPNPKFAHIVSRVRPRTSGSRGTRIIELLVVLDSEVRIRGCRTMMRTSKSDH